jgi:hypothetical protein
VLLPTSNYPFLWSDKKPFYVEYNGSYYRVQFTETVNKLTKIDNVSSVRDNKIEIGFSSSKPLIIKSFRYQHQILNLL